MYFLWIFLAESINKKKEDTITQIFNRKTNIKKSKTSTVDNGLEKLKKKINRQNTKKGWKCSFRHCNFINPDDVFICKSKIILNF